MILLSVPFTSLLKGPSDIVTGFVKVSDFLIYAYHPLILKD